jgi:hypothetical protein
MVEIVLLAAMGLVFVLGLGMGVAGLARRAWGQVLFGAMLCAVPAGFAGVLVAGAVI